MHLPSLNHTPPPAGALQHDAGVRRNRLAWVAHGVVLALASACAAAPVPVPVPEPVPVARPDLAPVAMPVALPAGPSRSGGRAPNDLVLAAGPGDGASGDGASGDGSPDDGRAATALCRRAPTAPPRGVLGLSDPNAGDPGVMDLIAQTGVGWVRAEMFWNRIEPVPGAGYDWGATDAMVAGYRARGIEVQAILTYMPDGFGSDAEIEAAFAAFAAAAVARYAPQGVHLWEVFNEPNLPGYGWLDRGADPQGSLPLYARLLARANVAVRDNDPGGQVILGGIASDQHRGLPLETTMATLYDLGARDCFDIMAYHPYGYQGRFPEARARVDAALAAGGDGGKPVWFNEYGWTEQGEMDLGVNPDAGSNPMLMALSQRGAADALFWFAAKDYGQRLGTPDFGLATYDLERRPSFDTFRHGVAAIRDGAL